MTKPKVDALLTGVSETALLTLQVRASEARRPDAIIDDPMAIELVDRIAFDFAKFDLDAACKQLVFANAEDRTSLLGLIARVTDADAILKIGERSYLKRVARAIGATEEELEPFIVADPEKAPKKKTTPDTLPHSRRNKRKL